MCEPPGVTAPASFPKPPGLNSREAKGITKEMDTFIDIIKNHPGLCRTIHVFCCNACTKIIYSFAKYKRQAYIDAKNAGWESFNRDSIWYCPECIKNYQNAIDSEAGSISA